MFRIMFITINLLILFQFVSGEYLREADYDILIFTQAWTPSSCYEWEMKSPVNQCNEPFIKEWSIHGLWPSKNGTMGPFFCNTSIDFNINVLKPLMKQLELNWLDIHKNSKSHEFWKHEWEKHGTCSIDLESLSTEKKYFQKALDLFDKYDMKYILKHANILPNETYLLQDYLNSIYKILGRNVYLECITNKGKDKNYLSELRICFNKKFELIDCNGVIQFPSNCNEKNKIFYPMNIPNLISRH